MSDTLKTVLLCAFFGGLAAFMWAAVVWDARLFTHKWVPMYPGQKDPRRRKRSAD